MNDFEQQLAWRIDTADSSMVWYQAPDIADEIWRRHQNRKRSKISLFAASISILSLAVWLHYSLTSPISTPAYIVQSNLYERQLAEFANVELSPSHSVIMANWQHELEVIDQTIERGKGNLYHAELWIQRTHILKMMIDFYTQPTDLYEI